MLSNYKLFKNFKLAVKVWKTVEDRPFRASDYGFSDEQMETLSSLSIIKCIDKTNKKWKVNTTNLYNFILSVEHALDNI